MDVPPIADVTPEPSVTPPAPPPLPDVARRLANLEVGLAEVNERLDALAVSLEASLREAVSQEVRHVSGELRHTVAELGRLLVRDLGKLSKLLSEHRDAIVADLAGAAAPSAPAAGVAPTALPAADAEEGRPSEGTGDLLEDELLPGDAEGDADGPADGAVAGEPQRRSLLRRRHG
ncbi:MAG TPA: hypothetical protein VHG90_05045 [Acidimicrobiales bacterium]|nr:hypothetical protein [Acidimicrobiales bacterium]